MPSDFLSRLDEADRARLERIGQGELVGELGFIDGTPRSADAFAGPGCVVTRWPVAELKDLLASDTAFGARFWRAMAEEVADRMREVTSNAVTGGLRGAGSAASSSSDGRATVMARSMLGASLGGLAEVDRELRREPDDQKAAARVADLLDLLSADLERRQRSGADPTTLARAVRILSEKVHPYLLRSTTAELALSAPDGIAGGPTVLRHVLRGEAAGDGALGLAVDRWLLDLPRTRGLRARHQGASDELERLLRPHLGTLRVVLVNCAQGPLLPRLWRHVAKREGELWIVEPTRAALTELDTALPRAGAKMRLRMVQEPVGGPKAGSSLRNIADVDVIVADALLDYLPARMATDTIRQLADRLGPRGRLLTTAAAPASDDVVWNHLLGWPIIARSQRACEAILNAAGCADIRVSTTAGSGLLASAGRAQA